MRPLRIMVLGKDSKQVEEKHDLFCRKWRDSTIDAKLEAKESISSTVMSNPEEACSKIKTAIIDKKPYDCI